MVANQIFRPIYGDGSKFETDPLDTDVITNGPFELASIGADGIELTRSQNYWNRSAVSLDSVRFVPKDNAEAALDAYKKGELDAVTNAEFEPLVLKLLAPYDDFRQTTHSALNFYEFNTRAIPFSDRRIREALAISIDRERLTAGELESSAQPATSFLPLGEKKTGKLLLDVDKAKKLMENAGYPNGEGFPKIRLAINRNDTQQRVARVVAKMWKQNLNLDTEINVKEVSELESLRSSGQYDLLRRGVVLPTVDESVSMTAILGAQKPKEAATVPAAKEHDKADAPILPSTENKANESGPSDKLSLLEDSGDVKPARTLSAEDTAVFELNAIPLYFPVSYSLVKPYVEGFEMNGLDAAMLQNISIDNNWQPKAAKGES